MGEGTHQTTSKFCSIARELNEVWNSNVSTFCRTVQPEGETSPCQIGSYLFVHSAHHLYRRHKGSRKWSSNRDTTGKWS